ncbi:MAG: LytR C-terminal domain-containing protein [Ignavibacteriales bacterium]|nr:LytR C-terminal domain-containing protein [Ignavibacteriales bacterium]
MEKYNPAKPKQKPASLKSPTVNILINVSIFLLSAVIIFMVYSLYIKLSYKEDQELLAPDSKGAEDIIQVDVRNGCGVSGVADRYTDFLRSKGFDVADIGNYVSSDVDETLIIDRIGNMANAYKVAKSLGIKTENVIQQLNKDYFIDVTVVIGKDYFSLTPFK